MQTRLAFHLGVSQDVKLARTSRQVHALLTVAARAPTGPPAAEDGPAAAAMVIIVDCSGSMGMPTGKFAATVRAATAAIDNLPDGTRFAVIQGTEQTRIRYPAEPGMVPADPQTRAQAAAAVRELIPGGATDLGRWLSRARELLTAHPATVRHALLLTDGWSESPEQLEQALAQCRETFTCDLLGFGDGWEPKSLQRVASVLHGHADAAAEGPELTTQVQDLLQTALRRVVRDVRLRVHTPRFCQVRFLKQIQPGESDLSGLADRVGSRLLEYPVGAWGRESRLYHLCLDAKPEQAVADEDLRAARVDLVAGGQRLAGPGLVLAHWTDEAAPVTELSGVISDSRKYGDLRRAVVAGCDAYLAGDRRAAEETWGRAVALADELADHPALERLRTVVDIRDAAAGEVRLRPDLPWYAVKTLELRSPRTSISVLPDELRPPAEMPLPGLARRCECGHASPPDANYCQKCRHQFTRPARTGGGGRG